MNDEDKAAKLGGDLLDLCMEAIKDVKDGKTEFMIVGAALTSLFRWMVENMLTSKANQLHYVDHLNDYLKGAIEQMHSQDGQTH